MHPFSKYIFLILLSLPISFYAQNTRIIDSLIEITENRHTPDTLLIKTYNDLGLEYAPINFNQAKHYISKALDISEQIRNKRGMAGAKNCLGVIYYYRKEYDSALVYFKEALNINKEIEHYWGQASALHQMGVIYKYKNDYANALRSFKSSQTLFETLKDSVSFAISLENIGHTYYLMGHNQQGTQYYLDAIKLSEKTGNTIGIGRGYNLISGMLINQEEDYQKALNYIDKALTILKKEENKQQTSSLLMQKAICYYKLNEYNKALVIAEQALSYRKLLGNDKTIASSQSLIGEIYYAMKNYTKSIEYLNNALHNFTSEGDYSNKTTAYVAIAKSYIMVHRLDSAKIYAHKAIELSTTINNLSEEKEGYLILSDIAEKEGAIRSSLNYYKKAVALTDSIYHIQKHKHAQTLRAIYETEQKEKQIEIQEIKINLLNKEASLNRLKLLSLLNGIGLIIIIFGWLFYINKQKIKHSKLLAEQSRLEKEKLDEHLSFKTRELVTSSLELSKKDQVLKELKQTIEIDLPQKDQDSNYKHLINILDSELNGDERWNQFRQYFEQMHTGFYAKVKQKYPKVTSKDLRLMSLIKMNLSNKEIGNILNITTEGIKKARYRLRKKMELESEEPLDDLIINL